MDEWYRYVETQPHPSTPPRRSPDTGTWVAWGLCGRPKTKNRVSLLPAQCLSVPKILQPSRPPLRAMLPCKAPTMLTACCLDLQACL